MDISDKPLTYAINNFLAKHGGWITRRDIVSSHRRLINSVYTLDEAIGWLIENKIIMERTVKTGGRMRREYCHRVHWENMTHYEREVGTNPIRDVLREDDDWVSRSQLHYRTRLTASEISVLIRGLMRNGEVEGRILRTGGKPRAEYRLKRDGRLDIVNPVDVIDEIESPESLDDDPYNKYLKELYGPDIPEIP